MKKLFLGIAAAAALGFAAVSGMMNGQENKDMAVISLAEALEDYEYMWKVLEEDYALSKVAERKYLLSMDALKENYRKQIEALGEKQVDFMAFYGLLETCVGKFQGLGHLALLGPDAYAEIATPGLTYMETDPFGMWCLTICDDPVVKERYAYLETQYPKTAGTSKAADEENLTFREIDDDTAYVKIKSFRTDHIEEDREMLGRWFRENAGKENIIIDISENGGGSDLYWMELLVAPNIDSPMGYEKCYVTPYGEESREPYAAMGLTEETFETDFDVLRALPNINEDDLKGMRYYRKQRLTVSPLSDQKVCKGRFFVLAGKMTGSASEGFAIFCKATGFAVLVGENTRGDGGGANVFLAKLPNSGLIMKYRAMHVLNPDGSSNVEFGTTPDVKAKRNTRGEISYLGLCLDYIESLEP